MPFPNKKHNMKNMFALLLLLMSVSASAQRQARFVSIAVTNNNSAFPFSRFGALFTKEFHPGVEVGYGFNWKTNVKHDWYQTFKAGYFFHRFVQHAVPLYTQLGYRYKLQRLHATAALGAGYLHSVPATAVLELQEDGIYENAKGIGRGQALILLSAGAAYVLAENRSAPTIFLHYRQQLQTPFIKSYVPLLPYNGIAIGITVPLKK
jgi:hypothetical protein